MENSYGASSGRMEFRSRTSSSTSERRVLYILGKVHADRLAIQSNFAFADSTFSVKLPSPQRTPRSGWRGGTELARRLSALPVQTGYTINGEAGGREWKA